MIDYCAFVLGGRPVNIVYQSAAPIVMKIIVEVAIKAIIHLFTWLEITVEKVEIKETEV